MKVLGDKLDVRIRLLNLIFRIYFVAESLIEEGRDAVFQMNSRGAYLGIFQMNSRGAFLGIFQLNVEWLEIAA